MFLSLNSKVHTVGYGDRFVYSTIKYFACAKPKSHGVDKNGCVCTHFTWLTHLTFNPVKKKKGTKKQPTHKQNLKKEKKEGMDHLIEQFLRVISGAHGPHPGGFPFYPTNLIGLRFWCQRRLSSFRWTHAHTQLQQNWTFQTTIPNWQNKHKIIDHQNWQNKYKRIDR